MKKTRHGSGIEVCYDRKDELRTFTVTLTDRDLARIRFDHIERQVIMEGYDNPADLLLGLEIVFRRLWEQQEPK